jgi:hypothetical protein
MEGIVYSETTNQQSQTVSVRETLKQIVSIQEATTQAPGSINKLGSAIRDGGSNDRFHPDDLIVWLFRSQEEEEKEECKKTTKKDIFRTDRIWRKSYTRRMTWPWRTHGTDFLADSFSPLFVEPIYFIRYVHITKRKGEESLSSSVQLCSYGRGKNRKREKKRIHIRLFSVANNEMKGQENRHEHPS